MPVAASIIVGVLGGLLPGKLGVPPLSLQMNPQKRDMMSSTFTSGRHSKRQRQERDTIGSSSSSSENTETEEELEVQPALPLLSASFVESSDPDMLCDLCNTEIVEQQCQFFWHRSNGARFWSHSHCFSTLCSQEGAEDEGMELVRAEVVKTENECKFKLQCELDSVLNIFLELMDMVHGNDAELAA